MLAPPPYPARPDPGFFWRFTETTSSFQKWLYFKTPEDTDRLRNFETDVEQNEKVTHSLHHFKQSLTSRAAQRKSASAPERLHLEFTAAEHEELSFTSEIDLVVETEDINDELHILTAVLDDQRKSVEQLEVFLHQARTKVEYVNYKDDNSNVVDYGCIDVQIHRITEMNELAERALSSLRHLIDLKQKQANFSEAISARELAEQTAKNTTLQIKQAEETTRQGKTLMVFTVVTIIFLPLSFLAAFFAINVDAFPWNENDKISLNYLLRYMLSIGFALAIPFVGLAFSIDEIGHGIVKVLSMGRAGREAGGAGHGLTALGKGWKPLRQFFAPGVITLAVLVTGLVMVLNNARNSAHLFLEKINFRAIYLSKI
ncbi:hypothetical protein FJTKL_00755 [Diaporthe vaccinii]|uniref:Ankyrin repeat protein n=1 Tax=Diaporthe vaccinii TaxID=105482 RepID=A0ABR4E2G0_9PEZI